ncbi:MAG TPA: ParB/RepB/Spo0J family partition protein [Methylotenera sp.]|nr:ParB/RepB/Spo0J family partition protein [Methylotenera sp.]HPN01011.1 ParB/RepB/Spo0J family partition protein [Methylotenera sp.]
MNTAIKSKYSFDLGALDPLGNTAFASKSDNQLNVVLAIPLSQIVEDEHQPRTDFSDDDWEHFIHDIQKHGVRNPIHVRPASADGLHKIINGARRYRASIEAGLDMIPCLIQSDTIRFDDYAQILDNIKNQAMAPMDIALFIKKRLATGDSKSLIAEQLSVNNNYITHHLALTEMSVVVKHAFMAGKVKGAQLIYRLNKLYDESPALVENMINQHDEMTNALILQARKSLEIHANDEPTQSHHAAEVAHVSQGLPNTDHQEAGDHAQELSLSSVVIPDHNPDNEASALAKQTGFNKIKKPLLLAYYLDRHACVVLLHERPTQTGLIWIKLEDSGEKIEVITEKIKLNLLTEARGKD